MIAPEAKYIASMGNKMTKMANDKFFEGIDEEAPPSAFNPPMSHILPADAKQPPAFQEKNSMFGMKDFQ